MQTCTNIRIIIYNIELVMFHYSKKKKKLKVANIQNNEISVILNIMKKKIYNYFKGEVNYVVIFNYINIIL